jgi:hypothetical protein
LTPIIFSDIKDVEIIDGHSHSLIPGFIDAHVHLHNESNLTEMARWGITTALDMASRDLDVLTELRAKSKEGGVTFVLSPGIPAIAPGSRHSMMPTCSQEMLVSSPEEAVCFIDARVAENADYIKVIADVPGFDQVTLNALVVCHPYKIPIVVLSKININ